MVTDWYSKKVPIPMDTPSQRKGRRRERQSLSVEQKEQKVKDVCLGRVAAHRDDYAERMRVAYEVGQVFSEKLATYYQTRQVTWMKRLQENKGVLGCCSRAAFQAEIIGASIEDYVEAQFWFFDLSFRRPPRYRDLAGKGANFRYVQWLDSQTTGMPSKTIHVTGGQILDPRKATKEDEMVYENRMLQYMIRGWGSEEKVWEMFGDPDNDTFPAWFKVSRPIWCEMYRVKK